METGMKQQNSGKEAQTCERCLYYLNGCCCVPLYENGILQQSRKVPERGVCELFWSEDEYHGKNKEV